MIVCLNIQTKFFSFLTDSIDLHFEHFEENIKVHRYSYRLYQSIGSHHFSHI
jgi:hypothetical protein